MIRNWRLSLNLMSIFHFEILLCIPATIFSLVAHRSIPATCTCCFSTIFQISHGTNYGELDMPLQFSLSGHINIWLTDGSPCIPHHRFNQWHNIKKKFIRPLSQMSMIITTKMQFILIYTIGRVSVFWYTTSVDVNPFLSAFFGFFMLYQWYRHLKIEGLVNQVYDVASVILTAKVSLHLI